MIDFSSKHVSVNSLILDKSSYCPLGYINCLTCLSCVIIWVFALYNMWDMLNHTIICLQWGMIEEQCVMYFWFSNKYIMCNWKYILSNMELPHNLAIWLLDEQHVFDLCMESSISSISILQITSYMLLHVLQICAWWCKARKFPAWPPSNSWWEKALSSRSRTR